MKYQETKETFPVQLITKKMFAICDNKGKILTHKDGHLLIFHRARDAKYWLYDMFMDTEWKIRKVQLAVTTL